MSYNISYSLLREFRSYMRGESCGLFFRAKHIDKTYVEPPAKPGTPAHAGLWFEQEATGVRHRDGVILMPEVKKDGSPTATYAHLKGQLANFRALGYADDIKAVGVEILTDLDGKTFKGVLDVVTSTAIRDIKTTGKINDSFDGWGWSEKYPFACKPQADQARMYIWLWWRQHGEIRPFYFDVFSNMNSYEYKSIPCTMTAEAVYDFEARLIQEAALLEAECAFGLDARPQPMRCHKCPLAGKCEHSTHETETINL